jgi:hypothetical protein
LALPFIETWAYHFHYSFKLFGIHNNGFLRVSVDNATAVVALTLKADQNGKLFPQIEHLYLNLGDSEIYLWASPRK